jgi:hypothetical protein
MAWMGTHGRNKRGTWCRLTKPLKTQMVVEKTLDDKKDLYISFALAHGTT